MFKLFLIGAGGFVGAVARWSLSDLAAKLLGGKFPFGTLIVNVAGCFFIGLLLYYAEEKQSLSDHAKLFLVTGLLGALTTFSTFGHETVQLIRNSHYALAGASVLGNLVLGLLAVGLGLLAARAAL